MFIFNLIPLDVLVQTKKVIDFLDLRTNPECLLDHFGRVLNGWQYNFDALIGFRGQSLFVQQVENRVHFLHVSTRTMLSYFLTCSLFILANSFVHLHCYKY